MMGSSPQHGGIARGDSRADAGRRPPRSARCARFTASAILLLAALWPALAMAAAADNPGAPSGAAPNRSLAREHRVALVIGNGNYPSSPLLNPVNDARAMGGALRDMGFQVTLLEDATMRQMADAARDFGDTLQRGGVGLFYYAGHGMQIKGRNYLIPVGADIRREDEVSFNALDAGLLLDKMESARSRINIVILDACRNNPFARSFRSASQGLAQMDAPVGSYLAFATAPAKVASDGKDGNGLYTQHLLEAMRVPGLKIEEVFKRVRVKVMADSEGQQVPWDSSSLAGDFYFLPPGPMAAAAPPSGPSPGAALAAASAAPPGDAAPVGDSGDKSPALAQVEPARVGTTQRTAAPAAAPPNVAAPPAADNKLLLAKASPSVSHRPAPPPAPKVDRAASEALAAAYKRGMEAKAGGDSGAAAEAFGRAAEGGHPGAKYEMGLLLKIGRKPVTQDLARAQRMFLQAAEQGSAPAQFEVAQMFAQGAGGAKNCGEATKWALKAAGAGSPEAAALLGELYRADCNGSKNPQEAARWLRAAAEKGLPNAQFSLGVLYVNGDGVPKDVQQARKWLTAAAEKGNASARFYLDRIGN